MEVLQVVVRSDAVYPFLIIPVRECIRSAYNGKCHGWFISQKAVIMPQERIGLLVTYVCMFFGIYNSDYIYILLYNIVTVCIFHL